MIYKNTSYATKTFYGIKFKPGEEHEVPGHINDPKFMRISSFSTPKPKKQESARKVNTTAKKLIAKEEESADGSNSN